MNTRTVYHWLLWLSAACIACLGFLLIRAEQHTHALDAALRDANNRSALYQSSTPQEAVRKAKTLVEKREQWANKKVSYRAFYDNQEWTVIVDRGDSTNYVLVRFDDSGKFMNYDTFSPKEK